MIVKMKFLSITGPKADIDRVTEKYLSKYEIHLENALTELTQARSLTPYFEINPYKESLHLAENYYDMLDSTDKIPEKDLSLEDALNLVKKRIIMFWNICGLSCRFGDWITTLPLW